MADIKAYGTKIVVKLEDGDFTTHDLGFVLPTNDKKRQIMKQEEKRKIDSKYDLHMRFGEVVSVGKQCKYFKGGETTRVNIHNGHRFKDKGHNYLSIDEIDTELVIMV